MENMFAQSFVEREVDRNKYYAGCTTYTTAARDAQATWREETEMKTRLSHVTVGTDYYNHECLHVWPDADIAEKVIYESPLCDDYMVITTTYHRAATVADVRRLQYDRDGLSVQLAE